MAFADLDASQQEEERAIISALKCPQCGQRRVKADFGWVCATALNCGGVLDKSYLRMRLFLSILGYGDMSGEALDKVLASLPQKKAEEAAKRADRMVKAVESYDRKQRALAKKGNT